MTSGRAEGKHKMGSESTDMNYVLDLGAEAEKDPQSFRFFQSHFRWIQKVCTLMFQ
jgi:hypothetical protein